MPTPLSEEEKARILALHADGRNRNAIAREVGRSAGAVTKIVKEHGGTFNAEVTKAATERKQADLAAVRATLEADALTKAGLLLTEVHAEHLLIQYAERDSAWVQRVVPQPPPGEKLALARASQAMVNIAKTLRDMQRETLVEDGKGDIDALTGFFEVQVTAKARTGFDTVEDPTT